MKKITLSFLAVFYLLLSSSGSVMAQANNTQSPSSTTGTVGPWYDQTFQQWSTKVYAPENPTEIFGERYTAAQVQWIIYGLFSFFIRDVSGMNQKMFTCLSSSDIGTCLSGITGATSRIPDKYLAKSDKSLLSAVFEERPISVQAYLKDVAQRMNLVKYAEAQQTGFGFTALNPILQLWKASRDISYSLFILVVIVTAFMVMFRIKISPQVVVSVQSALPRIAVAIVLVTFSYAIAGLLIDLMYVVIGILSIFGSRFMPLYNSVGVFNFLTKGQLLVPLINRGVDLGIFGLLILYLVLFTIVFLVSLFILLGVVGSAVLGVLGALGLAGLLGTGIGAIIVIVAVVVVLIAILLMMFKIIWLLLRTYANILLLTIFAPFQIVLSIITPSFGFGKWIKSYVTNLAVFVTVGLLFLLSFILLGQSVGIALSSINKNAGAAFFQLLSGTITFPDSGVVAGWPPLLGGGGSMIVAFLMLGASFVVFTNIAKAGNLVESLIAGKPFSFGSGIGEAVGPAFFAGEAGLAGLEDIERRRGGYPQAVGFARSALKGLQQKIK